MATSVYFNNYGASQEQLLIENLITEAIKIYGVDVYYIPRTTVNVDEVFQESQLSRFDIALLVEMYIKSVDGFEGDGEFLSKFGIQVRDQITFTMSQRVFGEEIGDIVVRQRPFEGDLIWFPFTRSLFQIKFVNVRPIFYQLGALQVYDIVCELYEGNSDIFDTGIPDIDTVYNAISLDEAKYDIVLEDGTSALYTEQSDQIILESYGAGNQFPGDQNDEFEEAGHEFLDFTEYDPFSEGERH